MTARPVYPRGRKSARKTLYFHALGIVVECKKQNGKLNFCEGYIYMNNWFTVEQIDFQTFAISEYKHWEETHCYLLCGQKKAILIDTGLGVSNIKNIVDSLTELPVEVITTHVPVSYTHLHP